MLLAGLSPSFHGPLLMASQVNGHRSGSDAQGGKSLREDLQEFLGGEALLHELDDLTKVNPVTLETGMGLPVLKSAISKGCLANSVEHMTLDVKPHVGRRDYLKIKS